MMKVFYMYDALIINQAGFRRMVKDSISKHFVSNVNTNFEQL